MVYWALAMTGKRHDVYVDSLTTHISNGRV